MKYQEFLNHISIRFSGNVKYELDRMEKILVALGDPHTRLSGVHIAGTNGKGSTSAMSEALLIAHGHTTGMNTSPHLVDYTERIRVNGKNITFAELEATYQQLEAIFEANDASFFEITTAMAFHHFLAKKLDSVVFEVGLGGRLDATNLFQSTVCAITSIGIDHPKSLGATLELIAAEKAGIIKKNTPVVLGDIASPALGIILDKAKKMTAPVYMYQQDYFVKNVHISQNGTFFDYSFPTHNIQIDNVRVNLIGKHQAINCAVALTMFTLYQDILGKAVSTEKISAALSNVNWPGRMQVLRTSPPLILDGAHNEHAIHALTANLDILFKEKIRIVIAILRDKEFDVMIGSLAPYCKKMYITTNHAKRAAELDEQVIAAARAGINYEAYADVFTATQAAIGEAGDDGAILVTGSLYTISEILAKKSELFLDK